MFIGKGLGVVKKALVTCWGDKRQLLLLSVSLKKRHYPEGSALQKPLKLTTWLEWTLTRAAGAIQKKARPAFVRTATSETRGRPTLTQVCLAGSISPLLRNVWENQEPECRERRVNSGRRVVRRAHPAGLPSTVHGS